MSTFEKAIVRVLDHEGAGKVVHPGDPPGWCDTPGDHGGETRFGISLKVIVKEEGYTPAQLDLADFEPGCLKLLTLAKALEIYRQRFWDRHQLYLIADEGGAAKALDLFVNCLPHPAARAIQRAAGTVPDALLGPKSFEAINALGAGFEGILAVTSHQHYTAILDDAAAHGDPTQERFRFGWLNRADCTTNKPCFLHQGRPI